MSSYLNKIVGEGFTFDDLLLIPSESEILPKMVNLHTKLTSNISLQIPIVSAAMDGERVATVIVNIFGDIPDKSTKKQDPRSK